MYDVYLRGKSDLLVVPVGHPIPTDLTGRWRKKKRGVRSISNKIREDIEQRGFHRRRIAGGEQSKTSDA